MKRIPIGLDFPSPQGLLRWRSAQYFIVSQRPRKYFVSMVTVPFHHKNLPALVWIFINLFIAQTNGFNNSKCAEEAYLTYLRAPNDTFLRDRLGSPTNQTSEAWGIGYQSCLNICGHNYSAQYYDWNFVSQGLTSWVLPWLALSAQLPFATNDTQTNFTVLMLALGSPSLIIFSLALTILNSRSINKRFRKIKRDIASLDNPQLAQANNAARVLLIGCQQIPIQIYNGPQREFAQLVVRPENWIWWQNLREEFQRTERGWTYSLYAQVGWVCVAQILAIADFFTTASFTTTIGIGLAINSLWIWMIPVVLGWVYVGTQTSAGSIEEALTRTKVPVLGDEEDLSGECIGIRDRTSFDDSHILDGYEVSDEYDGNREEMPRKAQGIIDANDISDPGLNGGNVRDGQEHDLSTSHESRQSLHSLLLAQKEHGVFRNDDPEKQPETHLGHQRWPVVHPQSFLGFSIAGCELEPGPIFNFARVWSHMGASSHVGDSFAMLSQRQKSKQPVTGPTWDPHDWKRNLQGPPKDLSKYCSVSFKDEPNLSIQGRSSAELVINCMIAAFMAVVLQWGSTGAAILIAYR